MGRDLGTDAPSLLVPRESQRPFGRSHGHSFISLVAWFRKLDDQSR